MLALLAGFTLSGRILTALAALAALVGAVWGYGHLERRAGREEGRAKVTARWQAAKDKQREVDAGVRRQDAAAAGKAAAEFEAWRADQQRRHAEVASGLRKALQRPISCPADAVVGDVLVPAAALDRLRAAGADGAPRSAAGEPGG